MANQQTTPEERQRRREQQRERLARATEELLTSEGWRRWLRARATFHSYSLRNTLLIAQQAEERGFTATHVAGFRAWLSLDRCVRKGERGLRILAPMSVRDVDEATGEERRRTFFREAAVFDTLSRARAVGLSSGAVGRLEALSGGRTPCSFRRRGAGEEPRRGDKPVPRRICCLRVLSRWGDATLVAPGPGRRG